MIDIEAIERATLDLLRALGADPAAAGLQATPHRVARAWQQFLCPEPHENALFEHVVVDQLVVLSGFDVWSICEHHLLPFRSTMTIGYIPDGKVLGISKLARIAKRHARRITMQERMVAGIAAEMQEAARPMGVGVIAKGVHMCMAMRGVELAATMTTSDLRGAFRSDPAARAELLAFVR